jgi:MtrB/PioB family decaheme-associated outer membrane protein
MRLLLSARCGALVGVVLVFAVPQLARAQAAATAAAQAAPAPGPLDEGASLFDPTWNVLQLSGRASSIDGDPARWQRYEDLGDGLLFTNGRFFRQTADWTGTAGADNVGWGDQRYFGSFERHGKFRITGLWDEIPQFYSVDTATPYVAGGEGVLVLDDAVQQSIQNQQANLNAYVPIAPQFNLRERRDIGTVRVKATPTTALDITGGFTSSAHIGELPWGASFGFSNDVEVALPYRSRTNDLDAGLEWTDSRSMFRAAYNGSWFNNQDDTLVWDSPLRLTDGVETPGRGRMALWPSNTLQTISAAGYRKFARRTQLTGSLSFGWADNNDSLLPFTINSALPQLALPRTTTEASAQTISANLNLVSRPADEWRLSSRFRHYGYNNESPATSIIEFVSYDSEVSTTPTGGPDLYAHSRNTFDADATWTGLQPVALTFGYTNNHSGHDFRVFESTNEHVLQLKADAIGPRGLTFRAHYEYGSRSGSGLDEEALVAVGEYPGMRHFDVADRTRNRFVGQVDIMPTEVLTFSVSGGVGTDDYSNSTFGLQDSGFRNFTFAVDVMTPGGFNLGGSYDYERYTGFQKSRSASPGEQQQDPNRDWTVDSTERVDYFSVFIRPPRIGTRTEARFAYEYAHARGNHLYEVGSALPAPSQLPETFNKMQDLRLDVRHRLTGQLAATFSYTYEPLRIYDFAFDPSVVDGIVQPSSLVLGYVYRPYTTHTAIFGVRYYW